MRRFKRILFEVIIIFTVFAAVNISFSQKWVKTAPEQVPEVVGWYAGPLKAVLLPEETQKEIYLKWIENWRTKGESLIPSALYDENMKKLTPYDFRDPHWGYPPEAKNYLRKAVFRDAVVTSTNDLEERIRKLENSVRKILAQCCPLVK